MVGVSVIIPLLNREKTIGRAIRSVLMQTYQKFEIIVIDGGSSDSSLEIIKNFNDNRIRIITQQSKGVSSARNEGVDGARYDIIAFLDSDDEWDAVHLKELLILIEGCDAGLYTTAYVKKKADNLIPEQYYDVPDQPGLITNFFISAARGKNPVHTSAIAIKRTIFIKMRGFDEGASFGEDIDLWGRIALSYPVAFTPESTTVYHLDATNRLCDQIWTENDIPFIENALTIIDERKVSENIIIGLKEYVKLLLNYRAYHLILQGRKKEAFILLINNNIHNYSYHLKLVLLSLLPFSNRVLKFIYYD